MVCTDSSRARSMNAQVLTMRHSASSARATSGKPASLRSPSISSESTWFLGQPSGVRWTFMRRELGTVVRELERDAEILFSQHRHDPLQIVLAFARHAHLVLLDRGLDLQLGVLDHPHDLARLLGRDPLLQAHLLAHDPAPARLDGAKG